MCTLSTPRTTIRPISSNDSSAVFAYRSDAVSNRFQQWIPNTLDEVVQFIERQPTSFNEAESWFQLVIEVDQRVIGDIGVHFIDAQNTQVEIGFTLSKAYQQQGFASEAVTALMQYLFTTLNKHRITASIDPENKDSENLLKRLGLRKEAHFIQSYWFKNRWTDDVIYAILRDEWLKKNN